MLKRRRQAETAKPPENESIFTMIDRLIWMLVRIVGPMLAAAILTPHYSVLLVLATAFLCWLSARMGMKKIAKSINWSLTGIVLGTAFSCFYWLPFWLGAPLGLLMLLGGLAGQAAFERRLGLANLYVTAEQDMPPERASAWRDNAVMTPEGEPLRCLNCGELGMGGPAVCTYLFPDGVLLGGIGTSMRFSDDGRYFAAPLPGRGSWGLLLLDRQTRTVYRHDQVGEFWEIDAFAEGELLGRHSPLTDNQPARIPLQTLLNPELAVKLEPVCDLWLEPGWELNAAPERRLIPAPTGDHAVTAQRYLPDTLKSLDDPLQLLHYPNYRMQVDGDISDLLIDEDEPVIWRADGQAFVCRAKTLHSQASWANHYWLWEAGQGWQQLAEPVELLPDEPVVNWSRAVALTPEALIVSGQFDYPELNAWGYGHYLQHTMSDIEIVSGHDPHGRLLLTQTHCSDVQLVLPLTGGGAHLAIRSALLHGGERAEFTLQHTDQDQRLGAYACCIGEWHLPGEWLLDHRVSDDGRYIALVAFADAPAAAHRVMVADVQQRSLITLKDAVLFARMVDFRAGELTLLHALGRLSQNEPYGPLRRYDERAPEAEQAASFMHRDSDSRLYYEQLSLKVVDGELRPLPAWRVVSKPQAANAAGDFILPSPSGRDAVWLFGAETEYRDNYPRVESPRGGGCLLTASGMGMSNVGPSMIWSEDGRYLAVTRYIRRMDCEEQVDTDQWQLILIDTQARNWRCSAEHIGCLPMFSRFDGQTLHVRVFEHDWVVEGDEGTVRALELTNLLALAPEPFQPTGPLWLAKCDSGNSCQWLALDRSHLQLWHTPGVSPEPTA